jgi:hypothetical protein
MALESSRPCRNACDLLCHVEYASRSRHPAQKGSFDPSPMAPVSTHGKVCRRVPQHAGLQWLGRQAQGKRARRAALGPSCRGQVEITRGSVVLDPSRVKRRLRAKRRNWLNGTNLRPSPGTVGRAIPGQLVHEPWKRIRFERERSAMSLGTGYLANAR